ncbi:hypothetical protein Pan258_25870 [Symmachiella dynata]|nr:hypothetical protein Pan258_25870 [Symmachiella dynata]
MPSEDEKKQPLTGRHHRKPHNDCKANACVCPLPGNDLRCHGRAKLLLSRAGPDDLACKFVGQNDTLRSRAARTEPRPPGTRNLAIMTP